MILVQPGWPNFTRAEFQSRLDRVFSPTGVFQKFIAYDGDGVLIFDDEQHKQRLYHLEFATDTRRVQRASGLASPPAHDTGTR